MTPADHIHQADAFLDYWKRLEGAWDMQEAFDNWCESKDFTHRDRMAIWAATEQYEPIEGPPLGWEGIGFVS